ncbi:hypothetical protein TWF506_002576 [Arthrobotrys conoides]|uniref:Uncharacterized protein n=1 Tax=Arthrobotrys conoides TaxID=74498 RepID=A0AAN8NP54_9PEZI
MLFSILPFLLLPLTFKESIANSAPEIAVEIYFTDYTIHRFKIDPFSPALCNWIPFHFLSGSTTLTPRIFAILASPELPPTLQIDRFDFSIHLGDNAIGCEDTRQTLFSGGVAGEAYNLTLPYFAPEYHENDVERARRMETRERTSTFVRGNEGRLDFDEFGNRIRPLAEVPVEEEEEEPRNNQNNNGNNSGRNRKDSPEYLFPSSLGGPGSDDEDDNVRLDFGGSRFTAPRNSPGGWRRTGELQKEEAKESEEREEESKDNSEDMFKYTSPPPRGGGGFSLQLQRRPQNYRQSQNSYSSPDDNFYGLANIANRIYQATGRNFRPIPGQHDPALDIDLSDPTMSEILFPPRQRNLVSQPPNPNTESARSNVEELDASPELFDENRPLARGLMGEFNAVQGQGVDYGDNDQLTEDSGEGEKDSPVDMTGNFNYDAVPDGGEGQGDQESPLIKKRSLPITPSQTKRLQKRVIESIDEQLDPDQPNPVQPEPAQPTPSLGFGESQRIAMEAQEQVRLADTYGSQPPYGLIDKPAAFKIRVSFSEKKVSEASRTREIEEMAPISFDDSDDQTIELSDPLLEFLSREEPRSKN